jgi:peptidoglycan/LPS O-acetylase OafA/YrhL
VQADSAHRSPKIRSRLAIVWIGLVLSGPSCMVSTACQRIVVHSFNPTGNRSMSATSQPARLPRTFYQPQLDILRFFAFLMVFGFHVLPQNLRFYGGTYLSQTEARMLIALGHVGAFGVNLFFVLSAFLITSLLVREREATGTIDFRAFYVRRILRIWPLYFLAVTIAVLWRYLDRRVYMENRTAIAYLLLAGNWTELFWPNKSFMLPLWSVSVEEQFYLSWPLVMRIIHKRAVVWFITALSISGVVGVFLISRAGFATRYTTFAQFYSIAVGILLAYFPVNLSGARARFTAFISGVTVLIAGSFASEFLSVNEQFIYPLVAVGTGLVFVSISNAPLRSGPLCYLGKISYGLYIYHGMCLYLVSRATGGRLKGIWLPVYAVASLALTIGVAALSYRFFESPFLRFKERFSVVRSRPV